jgi:hypothetical protein
MGYFPGNIMVIDDQFNLIYGKKPDGVDDSIQYESLMDIQNYATGNGIPLISISKTDDASELEKHMTSYNNVRLLILDLDLNNDGDVGVEDDYVVINLIINTAIKKYGYFILMIYSAHSDAWENITNTVLKDVNSKLLKNLTYIIDKNNREIITESLNGIANNYSLDIIFRFESILNIARDKAFSAFLDFNKNSWENIIQGIRKESGEISHFDITNILLGLIRQQMLSLKYPPVDKNKKFEIDPEIRKQIVLSINYIVNKDSLLGDQIIWTGNLYKTNKNFERQYALIINPECDIAQGKQLYYKVAFGFEINETTLPKDYNIEDKEAPLLPFRAGKNKKNIWKSYNELKDLSKPNSYLIQLPFASENRNNIFIDLRDIGSYLDDEFKEWNLLLRINDPFITTIIDAYSNLFNRKGLLPI